jgi:outer membrane lipoprotein carrier protein
MKLLQIIFISVFAFFCLLAPAHTATVEYPEDIAARLQTKLDELQSLSFLFYQDTQGEMSGRPRQGSGSALFYKGENTNRMRWDYTSPDKQVITSDGKIFSMYFEGLHQLIITPVEKMQGELTYSFFFGRSRIEENFHIRPPDDEYQESADSPFKAIKLIPKVMQSQVQDIHIWVTADSLIRRFAIRDLFGTITVLNLSDIVVNPLAGKNDAQIAALFAFTPPEGTEIIEQ